jgi:alpha-galactosidase
MGSKHGETWRDTAGGRRTISEVSTSSGFRGGSHFADEWRSVLTNMAINSFNLDHVNFYGRSDADMLEVGNKNLLEPQERTHFAIWAAMKSPLILGFNFSDIEQRKAYAIKIVTNKHLIEFNQDPNIGVPARPFKWDRTFNRLDQVPKAPQYWAGRYHDKVMVWLFNRNENPNPMSFKWTDTQVLQQGQWYNLTDAWTDRPLGCYQDSYTSKDIAGWDTSVLIVQNANGPCNVTVM